MTSEERTVGFLRMTASKKKKPLLKKMLTGNSAILYSSDPDEKKSFKELRNISTNSIRISLLGVKENLGLEECFL